MARAALAVVAALSSTLLAGPALADKICVRVDEEKDTLTDIERRSALAIAQAAFAKAGATVIPSPCEQQYTLFNNRLGETIYATLSGPNGQRDAKTTKIDELGDLYQQMAKSLVEQIPLGDAVGRNNVTSRQQNPKRMTTDSIYWFGLGPAYVLGLSPSDVPLHIAGGWRYELDMFALETHLGVTFATNTGDDDTSVGGSFGLAGYWFADEEANHSPYFGLGIGLSGMLLDDNDGDYAGGGLHGVVSGGYEFLRASTMRAFIQFDAMLPFYRLDLDTTGLFADDATPDAPEAQYSPLFMIKFGVGWGPRRGFEAY